MRGERRGDARLPDVFVARYRGDSASAARMYFATLWRLLRPLMAGRDAVDAPHLEHLTLQPERHRWNSRRERRTSCCSSPPRLLAERRLARGVKLNYPEAVAYMSRGDHRRRARRPDASPSSMSHGATLLVARSGDGGRPEMIPEIQVEATFPDGTKLVTVHHPIP